MNGMTKAFDQFEEREVAARPDVVQLEFLRRAQEPSGSVCANVSGRNGRVKSSRLPSPRRSSRRQFTRREVSSRC
jgi:hypothetical protein